MRIVHWAPQYGSETGTGKAIQGWLRALSARGLDCTVISRPLKIPPSPNLRILSSSGLWKRLNLFGQEIKTAHVVHLHGAFDLKLCAVHLIIALEKIWRMATGQPLHIVITPHGALSPHVFSTNVRKKRIYWNLIERLLAKQTSLAICTTPVEAGELRVLMPEMRVDVVPLVLPDSEPISSAPPVAGSPTLCTLGRYDIRTKGLDLLIEAVKSLNEEGFPIRLRCVGYDRHGGTRELEDYLDSVSAHEFVECVGPKFGDEKLRILAGCDGFCMPSRYESFSYALIEGLESGRPVLVSSGACLTSFFRESHRQTLVVEPSAKAWATAIRHMLESPVRNLTCAAEALADLRKHCTPAKVGEALADLYFSLWLPPTARPATVSAVPPTFPTEDAPYHAPAHPAQENLLETALESHPLSHGDPPVAPGNEDHFAEKRFCRPDFLPDLLGSPPLRVDERQPPPGRLFH
ncbi:MAG: glycosyltransferase [Verrucomicrobiota bacterium]